MEYLSNSFKSFFWNVLGAGLGFIYQMAAARLLGAEVYGQANYYLGYASTITIFINFGLQTFLPKYITSAENKKKMFSDVFWTYSILFLLSDIIIALILILTGLSIFQIILISIVSYLTTLAEIILAYNVSTGNAAIGMFSRKFLYSALNLALFMFTCLFITKEYYSYIIVMLVSYGITCIYFIIKNIEKPSFSFKIIRNSWGFYIIQLIYGVFISYSKVLQKNFGTFETVAILSISLTLGSLVAMLGDNFAKVSMPLFSKYWNEDRLDKLKEIYMTTTRINCYLVLPIALTLILNSNRILNLLGRGYNGGELIFIFIMISQFINSFTGPNGTILVMTKYTKYEMFNGIIKLITAIITISILGDRYAWAVAFSLALSEIIVNILKTIQVKLKIGIFPYDLKSFLYILIVTLVQFIIIGLISKIQNLLIWIVITALTMVIIYISIFSLSPKKEDRDFIKKVINKIIIR